MTKEENDLFMKNCIDLANMLDEKKCPVVQIDHEYMFNLIYDAEEKNREVSREEFAKYMYKVADNFYEYLNGVYEGSIE